MTWLEEISAAFEEFGDDAVVDEGFGPVSVTIPAPRWAEAVGLARDRLGCAFFDWLSAVDELAEGFSVVCHVARPSSGSVDHLLVRTRVPREQPGLPSVVGQYAGAAWHERETHEMFGISFDGQDTAHLLLPEEFEGHPLRKDFVLASRVAKPWPGAKEPGESHEGEAPSRRRMRPPGVPEPEQWGPREPGSDAPDPLAHAQPGPARPPRRARRADAQPEAEPGDG
ncbi:MAG: NADH-quinone oxidoreductase subunit C [Propionibacteriales bacterium]|nr:NADH-quinone oxidoreductase subunit C [Propionibacteriales bacterium]